MDQARCHRRGERCEAVLGRLDGRIRSALRRQREAERCAVIGIAGCPQPSPMCGDDAAADRQPEADTEGLACHKRLEDPLQLIGRNALAAVGDGDDDFCPLFDSVRNVSRRSPAGASAIASQALTARFSRSCCNCTRSPLTSRQTGFEIGGDRNVAADKIAVQQAKNLTDELVQVERLLVRFTALE